MSGAVGRLVECAAIQAEAILTDRQRDLRQALLGSAWRRASDVEVVSLD